MAVIYGKRLKIARRLLSGNGVIFISIDDREEAGLRLLCDEIFGENCFVSNISWQRNYSARNDSKGIVTEVEHLWFTAVQRSGALKTPANR